MITLLDYIVVVKGAYISYIIPIHFHIDFIGIFHDIYMYKDHPMPGTENPWQC